MVETHESQSGEGYILAISKNQLSADFLPQCASCFNSAAVWLHEWKVDVFTGDKRGRWRNMVGSAVCGMGPGWSKVGD